MCIRDSIICGAADLYINNGKITLSKSTFDLKPGETAVIYVKVSGTTDDIIADYDDDYLDIEWGDMDENGRCLLYTSRCV